MALGSWDHKYMGTVCKGGGPAILLAIYRARDDVGPKRGIGGSDRQHFAQGTGGHYYNILAPSPSFKILKYDWLLVLGSRQFGKKVHDLGLLRGAPRYGHADRDQPYESSQSDDTSAQCTGGPSFPDHHT